MSDSGTALLLLAAAGVAVLVVVESKAESAPAPSGAGTGPWLVEPGQEWSLDFLIEGDDAGLDTQSVTAALEPMADVLSVGRSAPVASATGPASYTMRVRVRYKIKAKIPVTGTRLMVGPRTWITLMAARGPF